MMNRETFFSVSFLLKDLMFIAFLNGFQKFFPPPWGLHLLRFLPQMLHHFMLPGGLNAMQPLLSDRSTNEIPAHHSTDRWLTVVATEGRVRLPTLWWDWFSSILVTQERYPPLPHPGPCVQKPALCLKLGTHCLFCFSNSRKSMSSFL